MFKDTLRAKNFVFLTDSHRKVWYLRYMQSGDFPCNLSPDCSLPLVFENIEKKNNINLVLLKD